MRTLTVTLLALLVLASSAHAEPTRTRAQSEAVVRFFAPLIIGKYNHLHVHCHRREPHGRGYTWRCTVRWTTLSRSPELPWLGDRRVVTRTRCRNPAFWNRPDEVDMELRLTRCRAIPTPETRDGYR